MAVKSARDSDDSISGNRAASEKPEEITDAESATDTIDSKATADFEKRRKGRSFDDWIDSSSRFVHNQVVKIQREDSILGKDIGEGLNAMDKIAFLHLSSQAMVCSRPILRSSPLGSKAAVRSVK